MDKKSNLVPRLNQRVSADSEGVQPVIESVATDVTIIADLDEWPHAKYRMTTEQALGIVHALIAAFGPNRWSGRTALEFYIFHLRQLDPGVAREVIYEITSSGDPFPPTA